MKVVTIELTCIYTDTAFEEMEKEASRFGLSVAQLIEHKLNKVESNVYITQGKTISINNNL